MRVKHKEWKNDFYVPGVQHFSMRVVPREVTFNRISRPRKANALFWGFLYYKNRKEALSVPHLMNPKMSDRKGAYRLWNLSQE